MKTIYLDNNATTRIAPEVRKAMTPYLAGLYGNPSSSHRFGSRLRKDTEEARAKVAALIGAEPEEVVFTGSGTESDNTALMSALECSPKKRHLITTKVEHPAVLNFISHLARKGCTATYLPVDGSGRLDMKELIKSVGKDTAAVSIMYANNETGVIFPMAEIAEALRGRGVVFHTDAVQAAGKVRVNVKETPLDMLSISGHKLHAPKGVGALYVRKGLQFHPYIIGGHQESGRRAGTENVASIIGLGRACELALERLEKDSVYLKGLRDRLESEIIRRCPDVRVNGAGAERLPNTVNISFSYIDGEAILLKLDKEGICASSGSACTSGSVEPSHVLRAMAVPVEAIQGSIRFSLSCYNTEAEIEVAADALPGIIKELRDLSPYGRGEKMC
ncbi:MAG: cysteine desulfurase NifS [Thermodesulfovibrionales bacterium]|nr:cysteine desulfurase NifS [Thermodesulfovibrionales bacterium]